MTGPIPIQSVNISPQFVQTQKNTGLEMLLQALQHRQELDIAKQKLQREQEQFELNKKLAGPQLEGMLLENDKKKRDLKLQEEDIADRDSALQLYTGNLSRLGDAKGVGEVIAGIKDPGVAAHFYDFLKTGLATQEQQRNLKPDYQFRDAGGLGGTEVVAFDPNDPTKPVRTGVRGAPNAASLRIPVVTEREKASVAIMAASSNTIVNRLEAADPTIPARLSRRLKNSRAAVGAVLKRVAGMSADDIAILQEQQVESNLQNDPPLLEYYQAQKGFLGPVLYGLSGKVVTGRDYTTQAPGFFAMGASNPSVMANRRRARGQRVRGFAKEAGDAMAERMAELDTPEEYGYAPASVGGGTLTPRKRRAENPY